MHLIFWKQLKKKYRINYELVILSFHINKQKNLHYILEDPTKCYVRWTLSTPTNWCIEDIKRKLQSVTDLTNFTIEFVYAGSLIIDTTVSMDMITDPEKFCKASLEFLRSFVKSCEIDTTVAVSVDVEILASFLSYSGKWFCQKNVYEY